MNRLISNIRLAAARKACRRSAAAKRTARIASVMGNRTAGKILKPQKKRKIWSLLKV